MVTRIEPVQRLRDAARPEVPHRALLPRFAVPARPQGLVVRSRLDEKLDLGVQGPLTLVSAPAGTGKTVAVASWVAAGRAPGPATWISVNDVDVGVNALWSLVLEGLNRSGVPVTGRAPAGAVTPPAEFLGTLADQIAGHPDPVTLVLDCDVEIPADAATGLHQLIRDARGQLRLILLTRADPLLPLHLYRLDATMAEIRLADLAFTPGEARELLARRGVELTPGVLDVVMARTRGWVAGLLLTSMSLIHWHDQERAVHEFTGASGTVAEYLLSEVLDSQSPSIRELLLRTSVVEVLRPGLVEMLAGPNAQRALTFLERGNAFLEAIPETQGWFRYHPLFRELLYAQLHYEAPEEVTRLHLLAARWLAGAGSLEDAVRQAIAAGRWEEAAGYVVDDLAIAGLMRAPATDALHDLAMQLPDDADGANVSLVRAAVALAGSDAAACTRYVDQAGGLFAGQQETAAAQLSIGLLRMACASAAGDHDEVLRLAESTRQRLADQSEDRFAGHPELVTMLHTMAASALLAQGRIEDAADAYTAALAVDPRPGFEREHVDGLGHLALIAAWQGHCRKAVRLAEQALALHRDSGRHASDSCAAAHVALAWASVETYDIAAARHHAIAVGECDAGPADAMPRVMLALVQARIRRAHGDLDGASALLSAARKREAGMPGWLADQLRVEGALVAIVSGQPARVPAILGTELSGSAREDAELVRAQARLVRGADLDRPVPRSDGRYGALPQRVDTWLLESFRQLRRGDEQQAAAALERSLRLAAPERLRRPFREAPSDVRRLFRTRTDLAVQHSWLAGGADRGRRRVPARPELPSADAAQPAPIMVEALTEKEREVLGHLAELLTTQEIAGAMFVSVNTIRTHVRNILRKLAVSRRNEAIRRARELNILS